MWVVEWYTPPRHEGWNQERAVRPCRGRDQNGSSQTWSSVSRVTWYVIRKHQHDLTVRDAETPDHLVKGQGIGDVAIVEPKTGCACLTRTKENNENWRTPGE